ncbi:hypothetical protein HYX19_03280, partial [Candidatus Woesearchaeota archaeon]|nr:hypothetical protein [Candidatus Woesearchaeota archaeon]
EDTDKTIIATMEVKEKTALFDIKINIPEKFKNLFQNEEVLAEINLINLGNIGKVDVILEYGIRKLNKILESKQETLAVDTQTSITRSFRLPIDIETGEYEFYGSLTYNNITISSSSAFNLNPTHKYLPYFIQRNVALIIILGAVVFIIIIFILVRVVRKEEKKETEDRKRIEKLEKRLKRKK